MGRVGVPNELLPNAFEFPKVLPPPCCAPGGSPGRPPPACWNLLAGRQCELQL